MGVCGGTYRSSLLKMANDFFRGKYEQGKEDSWLEVSGHTFDICDIKQSSWVGERGGGGGEVREKERTVNG